MASYGNALNPNPTGYNGISSYPTYIQPNNFSYGTSQMQNPYSFQQTIPMQQQMQPMPGSLDGGIRGRIVNSEKEIAPNEAPMDKRMTFFPLSDNTCIIGKIWDDSGKLQTTRFFPEQTDPDGSMDVRTDSSNEVLGRLDSLDEKIENLERLIKRNANNRNYNKKNYPKKPYDKRNQNGSESEE